MYVTVQYSLTTSPWLQFTVQYIHFTSQFKQNSTPPSACWSTEVYSMYILHCPSIYLYICLSIPTRRQCRLSARWHARTNLTPSMCCVHIWLLARQIGLSTWAELYKSDSGQFFLSYNHTKYELKHFFQPIFDFLFLSRIYFSATALFSISGHTFSYIFLIFPCQYVTKRYNVMIVFVFSSKLLLYPFFY